MAYADWAYYRDEFGGELPEREASPLLARASDAVDALTFCRINAIGWDALTDFQRDRIRWACCLQADFLAQNRDALESPLESYAINGVSMQFGNGALYSVESGVPVANAALALLRQTGLASLMARHREVRR